VWPKACGHRRSMSRSASGPMSSSLPVASVEAAPPVPCFVPGVEEGYVHGVDAMDARLVAVLR
jgi:hypothetical protein